MTSATIGIDPRIRARRVAVMRAEGRRRLRLLLMVMGVVTVIGGTWAVTRTAVLDVDQVRVDGLSPAAAQIVREAAGIPAGVPLLDVDLGAVETRIEALPWVREAEVGRNWPGTLTINVTERAAVAVVPAPVGTALMDDEGYIIATSPVSDPSSRVELPRIDVPLSVGVGGVHLDAAPGLAVVAALPPDLRGWVAAIRVADEEVGLALVGDVTVRMGPAVRLDDKVTAVRAVLAGVDLTCIVEIDVTAPDQTTIRRDPVCDAAARAQLDDA